MNTVTKTYQVATTVISSKDSQNTYEIKREFDSLVSGKKMLIITLYPTIDKHNAHALDSSWMHIQKHLPDVGIGTVRMIYLFSDIWESKVLASKLEYDEDNISYIESVLKDKVNYDGVVVAWGTSMEKNKVVSKTKLAILNLLKKYNVSNVYQLAAEELPVGIESYSAFHPLYLGLRSRGGWSLIDYDTDNAIKYLQTNLSDANKTTEKKKRGRPKKKPEVNAGNEATVTNVNDTNSETEEGDEE